jgi:16S rRNA (adenine1518-N6/adenine1519-N6)-dimethyltransferase
VIRLKKREKPPVEVKSEEMYFKVVKAAFAQRRKTLLNSIVNTMGIPKENAEKILTSVGIDPKRRGETLTMDEFAKIANAM